MVFTVSDRLIAEGYTVETALDGRSGLEQAKKKSFDLILLDVMLPEKNGFDVCRDLRKSGIKTPILMLTARGQLDDKVTGLKLGADDYLTKPFETAELLARIEAHLRRTTFSEQPTSSISQASERYEFGEISLDVRGMEVRRAGTPLELSAKEFQLLVYLIENQGTMLTRDDILNNVWGYDAMPTTRTVDTHVAWLRQKIEPNPKQPQYILTAHGIGYKFVC